MTTNVCRDAPLSTTNDDVKNNLPNKTMGFVAVLQAASLLVLI